MNLIKDVFQKTIIAIRLLGFLHAEEEVFAKAFLEPRDNDVQFMCLQEGCLQDPDIYLVNAEDIKAVATLSDLHPGEAQPVLLVGKTKLELTYPSFPRPVRWRELFVLLDEMVAKRQALLKNLRAFSHVAVPERRRRDRLDFDLTDPEVYKKCARQNLVAVAFLSSIKIDALRTLSLRLWKSINCRSP